MAKWVVFCLLFSSVLISQDRSETEKTTLSLEQCLLLALKNNISIRKLKIDKKIAGFEAHISDAIFEWKLNTTTSYVDDTDKYSQTVGLSKEFQTGTDVSISGNVSELSNDELNDKSSSVSFSITQQLLAGSSNLENSFPVFRSRIRSAQARNALDESIREVLYLVTRSFYQYIKNVETIKINNNALRQAKKFLVRVQGFKDAGRGTILDVATAEVQVASREEAVLRSKTLIENSLDQLKKIMGVDIDKDILISTLTSSVVKLPKVGYAFALKHAMKFRPDYKNKLLALELIQHELEVIRRSKKPNLSVTYSVATDATSESYNDIAKFSEGPVHSLSFKFSMPLLRKRKKANYAIKKYSVDKEKIALWDKQQEIKLSVKRVIRSIDERVKQIDVQEKKVKIETKRAESFEIRLKNGLIDSLELTRAYDGLDRARTDLVNSRLNLKTLIAEYHKVIGSDPTFVINLNKKEIRK